MKKEFWNGKRGANTLDDLHPETPQNVVEIIEAAFRQYTEQNAFTALGATISFAELDKTSAAFASYLQHHTDLQPGDRIAIQMPNVLQYVVVLFGALRAGLIIVNTNPLYTAREMKHQFNDAGVRALVYMNIYGDLVEKVLPDTSIDHLVECSLGDMLGFPKKQLINAAVKYVKKQIKAYSLPAVKFNTCLKLGKGQRFTPVQPQPDDIALLQYTGGTTGVAKGAMILHRNLVAQYRQIRASEAATDARGELLVPLTGATMICPLPLYHIYAFSVHCMASFSMGHHSVLITDPRDPGMFIRALQRWQFTSFTGINTLFLGLLDHPQFKQLDFSRLRLTVSGGAALSKDTARRWQEVTGCAITEGYGLTEASPTVCSNPGDGTGRLGSIGVPLTGTALKVVDEQGVELGFGEPGELCVQGPQVMGGYWQRPEETAEVLVDGWLKTGDIAEIDEDGFVSIVDRKKDMILVSGFNVFPNEIEDVVSSLPKVENCACIGVPSDKSGEVPKVFVVKADPSLTEAEVKSHCRENLTGYKQPRMISFVEELPMSPVGKVLRKELRNL